MPPGTLEMLVLRVLKPGPLHGYAIGQRIRALSADVLKVEEGALYPALQRMLLKGHVRAAWGISESKRSVRFYRLTSSGRKQLESKVSEYGHISEAIQAILRTA
jgi:transcriptional regulator